MEKTIPFRARGLRISHITTMLYIGDIDGN